MHTVPSFIRSEENFKLLHSIFETIDTKVNKNPHGADHKVFLAFAPYDDPAIAIACVAENAGDYPISHASRIVKRVLEEYFVYYPDTTVKSEE